MKPTYEELEAAISLATRALKKINMGRHGELDTVQMALEAYTALSSPAIKAEVARLEEQVRRGEVVEKELHGLRTYCTLTFGESHPEIRKCPHEIELEAQFSLMEKMASALNSAFVFIGEGAEYIKEAITTYELSKKGKV